MSSARLTPDGLPAGFLAQSESFSTVRVEVKERIGVLTLNRPDKLNAFDETMIREIRQVIWRANFDAAIGVLLITGAGRAFCSGRDILGLDYENNLPSPQFRAYVRANHEMLDDLEALEKPVIAAVNGVCAGGGVEIAISCDFRFAAKGAEFILTENKLGVLPASGACSRMIQIGADRAEAWGLVHRVSEPARLMGDALAFARDLLGKLPLAMGMAKHIINTCQNVDTETGRMLERLGQSVLVRSEDAREGMRAFREKRPPSFRNK